MRRLRFQVHGPLPRRAPYIMARGRPIVPQDVRTWRNTIAQCFLSAGGRKPEKNEIVSVEALYYMVKNHCDLDSLYHSLQDALSKDALHISDKNWHGCFRLITTVAQKVDEGVMVSVRYLRTEKNDSTKKRFL